TTLLRSNPYYIGGDVKKWNSLINMTPEKFKDRNIFMKTEHEITAVNSKENTVTVYDKNSDTEFTDSYDYLILSPGSSPKKLPAVKDAAQTFSLHKLADLDYIVEFIEENNHKEADLVGS